MLRVFTTVLGTSCEGRWELKSERTIFFFVRRKQRTYLQKNIFFGLFHSLLFLNENGNK